MDDDAVEEKIIEKTEIKPRLDKMIIRLGRFGGALLLGYRAETRQSAARVLQAANRTAEE